MPSRENRGHEPPDQSTRSDLATLETISAVGIKGEHEQRAVSSLLAVMVAVPEFGREIVSRLGAPAGRIST